MRLMSFALTEPQLMDGSKDVTRRLGWRNVKPGQLIQAVRKGMGIPKGEKVHRLCVIEVVSVRFEPLNAITQDDCRREGFPHLDPPGFVAMFRGHMTIKPDEEVTRIEFKRVVSTP